MFLLYVDESGDPGLANSPTPYFVLSGIVLHELNWHEVLSRLVGFRRRMRQAFGFKLREEIHASNFISGRGPHVRIARNDRLSILRFLVEELASIQDLRIINVVVSKAGKQDYDVFEQAWRALIQRFENTITNRNFPGPPNQDDRGLILCDRTSDKKLRILIRKMRAYNPVPHMSGMGYGKGYKRLEIQSIVEDPCMRDSRHSFFIQACDTVAFLLYQYLEPGSYFRKKGARTYFKTLEPVLCKIASLTDPLGIVRL